MAGAKRSAIKIIQQLAAPKAIRGHYGVIEGWECKWCRKTIGVFFFGCNEKECLGAEARRFLSK